jgi:hypothetical protein
MNARHGSIVILNKAIFAYPEEDSAQATMIADGGSFAVMNMPA